MVCADRSATYNCLSLQPINFVAVGNWVQRPAIGSMVATKGTAGSSVSIVLPVDEA